VIGGLRSARLLQPSRHTAADAAALDLVTQQPRLEGLNGLFQAARARARGYRSITTFTTIIYLIAAPLGDLFKST
jgi:hypothetical protein